MKLLRYGSAGSERPGIVDSSGVVRDLSAVVNDITGATPAYLTGFPAEFPGATVVRLILLPYALRLGGRFTWWLPSWLDRRLPSLDIGVDRRRNDRPGRTDRPRLPREVPPPRPRERPRHGAPVPVIPCRHHVPARDLGARTAAAAVVASAAIAPAPSADGS